jgi:TrkA domain protein
MRVREAKPPRIGQRYDLITHTGLCLDVVVHRSGRRDLVVFNVPADPDAASELLRLTREESEILSRLVADNHPVDLPT